MGKQKMLGLGSFPETSLASARAKRDDARKLLAQGIDPSQQRKLDKVAAATAANNLFGAVAEEYIACLEESGRAHAKVANARWLLCRRIWCEEGVDPPLAAGAVSAGLSSRGREPHLHRTLSAKSDARDDDGPIERKVCEIDSMKR